MTFFGCDATPEEIGKLRREIREAERSIRRDGTYPAYTFLKAATLSRRSWIHLVQRMRPRELKLLMEMCKRDAVGNPSPRGKTVGKDKFNE